MVAGKPLDEQKLRSLTFQNMENADDDARMRDGEAGDRGSTSRHDTPPRRGNPESAEEEIPVFDPPTEYGPLANQNGLLCQGLGRQVHVIKMRSHMGENRNLQKLLRKACRRR